MELVVTLGINSSGQIVEDMSIDVHINETLPLIQLVIPRPGVNILPFNLYFIREKFPQKWPLGKSF